MLSGDAKKAWPHDFGLVYSVTLSRESLETSLHVQNKGDQSFEFQVLFHSYLRIKVQTYSPFLYVIGIRKLTASVLHAQDITKTRIHNLQHKTYIDKVLNASTHTEASPSLAITQETDRIYQSLDLSVPIIVSESDRPKFSIARESLNDVVTWNPWIEKAKGISDFGPADGWKNMICVEAGSVMGWMKLEAGDAWEGAQTITAKL